MLRNLILLVLTFYFLVWSDNGLAEIELKPIRNNKTSEKFSALIAKHNLSEERSGQILIGKKNIEEYHSLSGLNVGVFITRDEFESLPYKTRNNVTPIYSEPDFISQMSLIKYLWNNHSTSPKVGVVIHNTSIKLERELLAAAAFYSINLKITKTANNPAKSLNKMGSVDFLLALPDSRIFNSKTLKTFLAISHRKKLPVIGFYTGMVKAGAVATTYKDVENLVEIVLDRFNGIHTHDKFQIKINNSVVRSYGLNFKSLEDAKRFIIEKSEAYCEHTKNM